MAMAKSTSESEKVVDKVEKEEKVDTSNTKSVESTTGKTTKGSDSTEKVLKGRKKGSYSVSELAQKGKTLFSTRNEVVLVALRQGGYKDSDLLSLEVAQELVRGFMKKEVK